MGALVGGVAVDTTQASWWQGLITLWSQLLARAMTFHLSGPPVPSTIAVYLDGPPPGQTMPGQTAGLALAASNPNGSWNWQYDAVSNSVQLNAGVINLLPTDSLYVTYTLACN
jgi:hypothetical protein